MGNVYRRRPHVEDGVRRILLAETDESTKGTKIAKKARVHCRKMLAMLFQEKRRASVVPFVIFVFPDLGAGCRLPGSAGR
jgi:hypothetical protein